jgi:hypothetical protein
MSHESYNRKLAITSGECVFVEFYILKRSLSF